MKALVDDYRREYAIELQEQCVLAYDDVQTFLAYGTRIHAAFQQEFAAEKFQQQLAVRGMKEEDHDEEVDVGPDLHGPGADPGPDVAVDATQHPERCVDDPGVSADGWHLREYHGRGALGPAGQVLKRVKVMFEASPKAEVLEQVFECETVREAEAFIAGVELRSPEDVHNGCFTIDAPEELVNPPLKGQ